MISGVILINKPKDWTSHDVVVEMRKITGVKKIGHSGTLDPFSTGLLILLIGQEATKQQKKFLLLDKTYWAKIRLGATSDTYDLTGKITENKVEKIPEIDKIKEVVRKFVGEFEQTPPAFSAKKIKGKKAYELARQGKKVELKPKRIEIYELEVLSYQWPYFELRARVSAGTYLRSLAHDIGQKLGSGGYLENLIREQIGPFNLKEAIDLEKITSGDWQNYLISLTKI